MDGIVYWMIAAWVILSGSLFYDFIYWGANRDT